MTLSLNSLNSFSFVPFLSLLSLLLKVLTTVHSLPRTKTLHLTTPQLNSFLKIRTCKCPNISLHLITNLKRPHRLHWRSIQTSHCSLYSLCYFSSLSSLSFPLNSHSLYQRPIPCRLHFKLLIRITRQSHT